MMVGIEEEGWCRGGDAGRKGGEDEVVPAEMGDETVGGGEIDADLPFLGADLALQAGDLDRPQRPRLGHAFANCVDPAPRSLPFIAVSRSSAPGSTCAGWRVRQPASRFAST